MKSIQSYKENAKSQTVTVGNTFLKLPGGLAKPFSFFRINDGVMGGKSDSTLKLKADGGLEFSGTINTNG